MSLLQCLAAVYASLGALRCGTPPKQGSGGAARTSTLRSMHQWGDTRAGAQLARDSKRLQDGGLVSLKTDPLPTRCGRTRSRRSSGISFRCVWADCFSRRFGLVRMSGNKIRERAVWRLSGPACRNKLPVLRPPDQAGARGAQQPQHQSHGRESSQAASDTAALRSFTRHTH